MPQNCPLRQGLEEGDERIQSSLYCAPLVQHLTARPTVSSEETMAGHRTGSGYTEKRKEDFQVILPGPEAGRRFQ